MLYSICVLFVVKVDFLNLGGANESGGFQTGRPTPDTRGTACTGNRRRSASRTSSSWLTSGKKNEACGGPARRREQLRGERPDGLSIRRGCERMSLACSTHYYRPHRRAKDEDALKHRIEAICDEFPRYGYRRVTAQLHHEGWRVNHKRVARIMLESGLSVKPRRRTVPTSDGGCGEAVLSEPGVRLHADRSESALGGGDHLHPHARAVRPSCDSNS